MTSLNGNKRSTMLSQPINDNGNDYDSNILLKGKAEFSRCALRSKKKTPPVTAGFEPVTMTS